jgi:hypothetical protein
MRPELEAALVMAKAKVAAMSPAEREAMLAEQRRSFVRAMAPCEHGVLDWETCPDCRAAAKKETGDDRS